MRKAEISSQAGVQADDSLMWHGSFRPTILKICQEVCFVLLCALMTLLWMTSVPLSN